MYTVLIKDDNSCMSTHKERLMEKSKLIDTFGVIVRREYNNFDMSQFTLCMEYRTPISNSYNYEELQLSEEAYEEGYLLYTLPIDTNLTAERGQVSIQFKFLKVDLDVDGVQKDYVRNISPMEITIIPIDNWFAAPDDALHTLTQMLLANQKNIAANMELVNQLNQKRADDIKLDEENKEIYVTANGKRIGTGITLEQLGNELAENTSNGLVKINI